MADRESIQELFRQAADSAQKGNLPGARRTCEKALEDDPENASGLQLLGMICWHLGDISTAKSRFLESLAIYPQQPSTWHDLGNIYDLDNAHEEALQAFLRAVELNPEFADAWIKLGIKYAETGQLEASKQALGQALSLRPGDIQALYGMGQACQESHDPSGAIECYQQALVADPGNVHLLHSLGIALRHCDRNDDAIECYSKALSIDPDHPEVLQSLGHVLFELGRSDEAEDHYQRCLKLRPDALDVHASLNSLYWQHGMHERYLKSYEVAIESQPDSLALRLQYASAQIQRGDTQAANDILWQADNDLKNQTAREPAFYRLQGQLQLKTGQNAQAEKSLKTAIELAPRDIGIREDMARLYINAGGYQQALDQIEAVIQHAPYNQNLIAYQSLCWRLLNDRREAQVNDYQGFIKAYSIALPSGYSSHAEFNRALSQCLEALHNTQVHPMGQTLRQGTQTQGNVFDRNIKEIQELRESIEKSVGEYIDSMEMRAGHPLLGRKCANFRFTDSWSSRLSEQGYHTNHIHSEGWISSCYYVQLPEVVASSEDKQGWIKFGETNLQLGAKERIARYVQPKEGLLVLFPSYMFHGTVAFSSAETRTTIAFDIVPD